MSSGKKRVTTYPPNSAALQMDGDRVLAEASESRRAYGLRRRLRATAGGAVCRADLGGSSSKLCENHNGLEKGFQAIAMSLELRGKAAQL